jgi:hypothetical protein
MRLCVTNAGFPQNRFRCPEELCFVCGGYGYDFKSSQYYNTTANSLIKADILHTIKEIETRKIHRNFS